MLLALALACAPPAPEMPAVAPTVEVEVPRVAYADRKAAIAHVRAGLAARLGEATTADARAEVVVDAREAAVDALTASLFPAWEGTPWAFYGTTEEPGTGEIACGYFVSTTLRDAGFRVERVRLAQQPAENIIKTLVPAAQIRRYRSGEVSKVVAGVMDDGPGVYLVGLDYHVGYLWNDGATVRMCHSSWIGEAGVMCEDAAASGAMVSGYHVVGKLMSDDMVERWLTDERFPTVGR